MNRVLIQERMHTTVMGEVWLVEGVLWWWWLPVLVPAEGTVECCIAS